MILSVFLVYIGGPRLDQQLKFFKDNLAKDDILYLAIDGEQFFDSFNKKMVVI